MKSALLALAVMGLLGQNVFAECSLKEALQITDASMADIGLESQASRLPILARLQDSKNFYVLFRVDHQKDPQMEVSRPDAVYSGYITVSKENCGTVGSDWGTYGDRRIMRDMIPADATELLIP